MEILVISKEMDIAVDKVINWLFYHYRKKVFKITIKSNIGFSDINTSQLEKSCIENAYGNQIIYNRIAAIWIHGCNEIAVKSSYNLRSDINDAISGNLSKDYNSVLISLLKAKIRQLFERGNSVLGEFHFDNNIKLYNLIIAKELGFTIPETYIVTNTEQIKSLFATGLQYITKSMDNTSLIYTKSILCSGAKTKIINSSNISHLNDTFHVSLVQAKIEKKYELRIFFYCESFFSMAIFSQNDPKTQLDFRNYNREKPNRYVPHILPDEIKINLIKLINELQITTGSIDLIVTKSNDYVFLEINPCGQFSFVSTYCNYNIEKYIAKYLSHATTH